jgi:RHS repeat-associated protein
LRRAPPLRVSTTATWHLLSADTPFRLQGQYWDDETGLAYNRFRYFDPEVGVFVNDDPLGLAAGLHGYSFAPNTYSWTDPFGLTQAPAGLPNEPGIYIITNKTLNQAYVGSAGSGAGGMFSRVSSSNHPAQALRQHPDTVVQYKKVCLGTATSESDRDNILRKYEQQEFDRTKAKLLPGGQMLNSAGIQAPGKVASTDALVALHGASKARNPSTAT